MNSDQRTRLTDRFLCACSAALAMVGVNLFGRGAGVDSNMFQDADTRRQVMPKRPDDEAAFQAYCDTLLGHNRLTYRLEQWRDQLREKIATYKLHIIQGEFDADRIDKYLAELKGDK